MKKLQIAISAALLLLLSTSTVVAGEHLRLATTTSTENSGLLAELLPPFEQSRNCQVDVIAVGTGKAIKLGESGDVDVVLLHARTLEERFIAEGHGVDRRDVMYNDFVLLGPVTDPAALAGMSDVAAALGKIAAARATFVSRADDSGTHVREQQLWQAAGVQPGGSWYLQAGRGMGEVLVMADERQGYALSDRGTYLAFRHKTELQIAVAGDPRLFNPYSAIMVNPQRHPHVRVALAKEFLDYLVSPQAKAIIAGYRKDGEQLFYVQ